MRASKDLIVPVLTFLVGIAIGGVAGIAPVGDGAAGTAGHATATATATVPVPVPVPPAAHPSPSDPRIGDALARARTWLDAMELDPKRERELGLGPYKMLVELMSPYARIAQTGSPSEAEGARGRITRLVEPSLAPGFMDLASATDEEFSRDSMSYLRAGYLLKRVGLPAEGHYRAGVGAIKARLDADFPKRGVWQKEAFAWYYEVYGLTPPAGSDVAGLRAAGLIGRRPDPRTLSPDDDYVLAHEVFIPYRYGELRDARPFDTAEKAYLRAALAAQANRWIMDQNPDLLAEMLQCMSYVGLEDEPVFADGISYLLAMQHADGSWGTPPKSPTGLGAAIEKEIYYLHPTETAFLALKDVTSRTP
jgi:hypothetical protein